MSKRQHCRPMPGLRGYPATGLRSFLPELLQRKQSVHGAGAEAFQVKGHKLEAQSFEDAGELGGHFWSEGAGEFIGRDLNPNYLSVMADPALAKSQGTQCILASFDHGERLARYGTAILDAG